MSGASFCPAPLLQDEASTAEQRIGCRLKGADHRPNATPIDQPATRAGLPDAAGTLKDVRKLLRAAHCHHSSKLAELNRADASGQRRGWRASARVGIANREDIASPICLSGFG